MGFGEGEEMRIALAGSPGCGRTTLFRALAGSRAADPGKPLTVQVPDPRLDFLATIWSPRKTVHATIVFTDTPSPAFSSKSLSEMRDASALALVLDNFARGDPAGAFASCETELMLADLSVVERRMERLAKESRARTAEYRLLEHATELLGRELPLRTVEFSKEDLALLSPYALLSLKPVFAVSNRTSTPVSPEDDLERLGSAHGASVIPVDAAFELELTEIPEADRAEFLSSMGYSSSGLSRLIEAAYSSLDLISFLTMGPDEVRAWPLRRGSTALDAAGAIHSDLARGFIRAQVTAFADYQACTDAAKLREKGAVRLEGREYEVRDGDILEIRFSV